MSTMTTTLALSLAVQALPPLAWFAAVNDTVPDPYLDEVFHVRQAQHYCTNHFEIWDPKITTPPGLYLLSYLISPVVGCDIALLRCLGVVCIIGLFFVVSWACSRRAATASRLERYWNALNVTHFPPVLFFSALYYTDVASTFSVLLFYGYFVHFNNNATSPFLCRLILVILGLISLLFRQTNIFWVAVFPAGLVLVNQLDRGHEAVKDSMHRRAEGFGDSFVSVAKSSWKYQVVYDPPVHDAWLEDYLKTVISLAICALKIITQTSQILNLATSLTPYLALLLSFACFILWNGSVVLGDKSNHVATVHLPQMLYIWPYFTFFSWPLLYPYLLAIPLSIYPKLANILPMKYDQKFKRPGLLPRLWILTLSVVAAAVVVKFNTIIHPFTLADNRHYTFYVFRLLTRPWWMRYAVTPVYVLGGWACIQALGAPLISTTEAPAPNNGKQASGAATHDNLLALPNGTTTSANITFVTVWLATTTLQLITAPLVEPRYLILPWMFWRMHVPVQQRSSLLLESAWFLLVNGVTGYIFLKWGFEWPQEPGLVQRFMW